MLPGITMPHSIANPYLPKRSIGKAKSIVVTSGSLVSKNASDNLGSKLHMTKATRQKNNSHSKSLLPAQILSYTSPIRKETGAKLPISSFSPTSSKYEAIKSIAVTPPSSQSTQTKNALKDKSKTTTKTKPKKSIKASFKAQLRREINGLKKHKIKVIQDEKKLILQRQKEKVKQERMLEKQRLEEEKLLRKQEKIEHKKRVKEELKMKLKLDLERKQRVEEEKIEKKRREQEEREKVKEKRRKEKDLKWQLEMKRKRAEAQRMSENLLQQQQFVQTRAIQGMNVNTKNKIVGQNQYHQQQQCYHQPLNMDANRLNIRNHYGIGNFVQNNLSTPLSFHSSPYNFYNPFNTYNYFKMSYASNHMNNQMNHLFEYPSNAVVPSIENQIQPYKSYTNNCSYPSTLPIQNEPLIRITTERTRKKNTSKQEKVMMIHEHPLEPPSPFFKTHVMLPYQITIYKEKGLSFGMNIRYETRGTFVDIENDSTEKNGTMKLNQKNDDDSYKNSDHCLISTSSIETHQKGVSGIKIVREGDANAMLKSSIEKKNLMEESQIKESSTLTRQIKENLISVNPIKGEKSNNIERSTSIDIAIATNENKNALIQSPLNVNGNMESKTILSPHNGIILAEKSASTSPFSTENCSYDTVANLSCNPFTTAPSSTSGDKSEKRILTSSADEKQYQNMVSSIQDKIGGKDNSQHLDTAVGESKIISCSSVKSESEVELASKITKKAKRKKLTFGVMSVTGANKQRAKAKVGTMQQNLIQTNDIILKINDQSLSGLTFHEAANIFANIDTTNDRSDELNVSNGNEKQMIQCTLTVAREKKVLKILDKLDSLDNPIQNVNPNKRNNAIVEERLKTNTVIPDLEPKSKDSFVSKTSLVIDEEKNIILSGDFSTHETRALMYGVLKSNGHYMAFIEDEDMNSPIPSIYGAISNVSVFSGVISRRNPGDFIKKWFSRTNQIDKKMMSKALKTIKEDWRSENVAHGTTSQVQYMLESQRCLMRNLPRTSRGCKCGSKEHDYVNHPSCILYRNISNSFCKDPIQSKENKLEVFDKYDGKLNSIGMAHLQRIRKRKEEEEAERVEAEFVAQMERIQVRQLKRAIFSPNALTILVLSSIASSCDINGDGSALSDPSENCNVDYVQEMNEEDIPLEILGKRHAQSEPSNNNTSFKKRKVRLEEDMVNLSCLAELLLFISKTWGHLFREPEHLDYAWYEECKTIKNSSTGSKRNYLERNPRQPGSFSFEIIKYMIDEDLINRLRSKSDLSNNHDLTDDAKATFDDDILVLHLASDLKTGLLREINTLVDLNMVKINDEGFTSLKSGWEKRVHPFILNDMWNTGWSKERDTENKFCIHSTILEGINQEWKRSSEGWTSRSIQGVCHTHNDFLTARRVFESNFEDSMNEIDGIAQFGI